jgi:hypothetical protein
MADAKKIKEEELQVIREAVSNFNRAKATLGDLEYQKSQLVSQIAVLEENLKSEQVKLEESYGSITVNLENGEYEETVQEAVVEE